MAKITVDFSKQKGKIKPVNGVGQPPILYGVDDDMFHYLTEAHIPFSRLHDTGGFLGGNRFVDVPNLSAISTPTPTIPRRMILRSPMCSSHRS